MNGNATFDDSYTVEATFRETGKCSNCGKSFNWSGTTTHNNSGASSENKKSNLIDLDFSQNHAVSGKYDLKSISCLHHSTATLQQEDFASTTAITTSIRFKVLAEKTTEIKAAYAHAKIGLDCTLSGSVTGSEVSAVFRGIPVLQRDTFTAAPITLRCN